MNASKRASLFTRLAGVFLLIVLPLGARAQGGFINGQIISNTTGKPAAFATVRVCPYSGGGVPCSPLSSLYSDPGLTQPVPNPYTSDQYANYSFAVTAGNYIVQIVPSAGVTFSYLYTVSTSSGSGVTSVGLALPVSTFSISGSPVINTGTLTGAFINQSASRVFAGPVSGGSPAVPTWRQLTGDDIAPSFAISTFTCSICGTVEAGVTTASPATFTASYSSLPASAAISDGVNTDPLTTPFTSGSLAHTYCTVGQGVGSTTFTLTAVAASTKTATQTINCTPRSFGGTGTGGSATGATASGNNAILVGATGTLTISYLGTSCSGQTYNVTTSGIQYVYLILPCNVSSPGSGSFTTPGPAVFSMNTPTSITFTNQFTAPIPMYLYRSTNSFFNASNFNITVNP